MPSVAPSSSTDRLPHILAFGVRRLKVLLQELAPLYLGRATVEVMELGFDAAVAEVRARRATASDQPPVDVLVAAGSNGAFLRQHLDLPVALVKVSGFDVMRALAHARRLSPHIALVTYGSAPAEWAQFDEVFALNIVQRSYRNEDEARLCVHELQEMGIQAVVAPGLVADLASEEGMKGIFLYSQDAVREALDDAVEIARVARIELARRERLNTILGQLKDGVVAVDMNERIETLNPAMEHLLGVSADNLLGKRLSDIAPELSLGATLRVARAEVETIQRFGKRMLVTSRLPIVEQGVQTGAVLACQDPVAIQRVDRHLRSHERAQHPRNAATRYTLEDIVGNSPAMQRVRDLALRCAASDATVLIVGESGTGKEVLAQGIHRAGRRAGQPFIAINCAAFPEALLESELFGYEEGAFTGSRRGGKAGLFEAAHTGTIFLDEIGEMPAALQTRLLRVLQEREILRIGATEPTPIDVRVIAATHRKLEPDAGSRDAPVDDPRTGPAPQPDRFRSDLYYRLNILRIEVPPLRGRREDLAPLAQSILQKVAARLHTSAQPCQPLVDALLAEAGAYAWPGNVRELENLVERLVVYGAPPDDARAARRGATGQAGSTTAAAAARQVLREVAPELMRTTQAAQPASPPKLRERRDQLERERILAVLNECHGDRASACARLGIGRTTLWRKLKSP